VGGVYDDDTSKRSPERGNAFIWRTAIFCPTAALSAQSSLRLGAAFKFAYS
jgi:hypothetical protein